VVGVDLSDRASDLEAPLLSVDGCHLVFGVVALRRDSVTDLKLFRCQGHCEPPWPWPESIVALTAAAR
jgi:hypothetical protein